MAKAIRLGTRGKAVKSKKKFTSYSSICSAVDDAPDAQRPFQLRKIQLLQHVDCVPLVLVANIGTLHTNRTLALYLYNVKYIKKPSSRLGKKAFNTIKYRI